MDAYTIRDAGERLDDLVGRVEAGGSVDIARAGRVVARIVRAFAGLERTASFDWAAYRAWAEHQLPFDPTDSVAEMRRQARYW